MTVETCTEARFYFDKDMSEPEVCRIAGGSACVWSSRRPDCEIANEDAALLVGLDDRSAVLAVADGMGGGPLGERAAARAIRALAGAVAQAFGEEGMLRTAILNGIEAANRAVQSLGVGAATTLAAAEVSGGKVRTYHIGDSVVLVAGGRGKIKLQTVSHSPVGFAVESGELDESEAMNHEGRHIVSNVVGSADMRIELGASLKLAPRDTLLLATDGLFDNLYVEEIVSRMRRGPIDRAARRLGEDAGQRMTSPAEGQSSKPDDLTFVLFRQA